MLNFKRCILCILSMLFLTNLLIYSICEGQDQIKLKGCEDRLYECHNFNSDIMKNNRYLEDRVRELEKRFSQLEIDKNKKIEMEKEKLESQLSTLSQRNKSLEKNYNKDSQEIHLLKAKLRKYEIQIAKCKKCLKKESAIKTGGKDYARAIELYEKGLIQEAINRLITEIKRNPNNQIARDFLEEIEGKERLKK